MSLNLKRWAAAMLVVAGLSVLAQSASADLLGFWDFNNESGIVALDQSGNGNHGKISGEAVYTGDQGGWSGKAGDKGLTLDGVDDFIEVIPARTGAFSSIADSQALTVSFWQWGVDPAPNSSSFWAEPNRAFQAHVPWSDTNIYFDTAGCCAGTQRLSGPTGDPSLYSGQWNHWVFLKDGGAKRVYVNGSILLEDPEEDQTAEIPAITGLWLGSANSGSYAVGEYDDYAIWDEALSESQITTLYEDGVRAVVPGLPTITSYTPADPTGKLSMTADNLIHASAYLADPGTKLPVPGQDPVWDLRQVYIRDLGEETIEFEVRLGSTAFDPPFGPAGTTQLGDQTNSPGVGVYVGPGQTSTYRLYVSENVLGTSSVTEATFTGNAVGPTGIPGDIDGNGKVDLTDFGILKDNFGKSGAAGAAVPEPSTFVLAGLGLLGLGWAGIRRRQS